MLLLAVLLSIREYFIVESCSSNSAKELNSEQHFRDIDGAFL